MMFIWHTLLLRIINMRINRTSKTLLDRDIENRRRRITLDTLLTIKERKINRTVRNIIISDRPLIILLDEIINSHIAERPISRIDIGLEDSRREDDIHGAVRVDDRLDGV